MIVATIILVSSFALCLFYIQVTCQKILRREFEREYFTAIATANRLEFVFVRRSIEEFNAPLDYAWVRLALKCDYLALTYLLKNAANSRQVYSREERLLMLYFRVLFLLLFVLHLLKLREKPAILKLTTILQHFANLLGERVSRIRFGNLSASEYLLTL